MSELRKYTRLPIDIVVKLQLDSDSHLYGETTDISFDGAFIMLMPPPNITTGQSCRLELLIKKGNGTLHVAFKCSIAHFSDNGIGLRFECADSPHHDAFLKCLISGGNDMDTLLDEISQHPRSDFSFSHQ
jgi:PilZ domain